MPDPAPSYYVFPSGDTGLDTDGTLQNVASAFRALEDIPEPYQTRVRMMLAASAGAPSSPRIAWWVWDTPLGKVFLANSSYENFREHAGHVWRLEFNEVPLTEMENENDD